QLLPTFAESLKLDSLALERLIAPLDVRQQVLFTLFKGLVPEDGFIVTLRPGELADLLLQVVQLIGERGNPLIEGRDLRTQSGGAVLQAVDLLPHVGDGR